MAYCSEEDVIRLTIGRREETQNETPADLDLDQIRDAIADAEAQVNLALKRRYVVPFTGVVPDQVRWLTANIASYLALLTFRGASPLASDDPNALRYDRARRMLDAVQTGRADIDGAIENIAVDGSVPSVFNEYEVPLFPLYPTFEENYIPADKYYR